VTTVETLTPEACIHTMELFWREQVEAVRTREGIALTLPLMYPDGWQATVHLTPSAPGFLRLSDHGKALGSLIESGLNLNSRFTASLLEERLSMFEVRREGLLITKDVRLPLQGVDIQIFAESLVSIAHLIYRHEPASLQWSSADKVVRGIFAARNIRPRRNVPMEGQIEKRILVDYVVDVRGQMALEVVHRKENLLPYMEQWAFRWDDLRKKNKQLVAAMVYDPENQAWDSTALRIGSEVCDVFCRYDEAEGLSIALDHLAA